MIHAIAILWALSLSVGIYFFKALVLWGLGGASLLSFFYLYRQKAFVQGSWRAAGLLWGALGALFLFVLIQSFWSWQPAQNVMWVLKMGTLAVLALIGGRVWRLWDQRTQDLFVYVLGAGFCVALLALILESQSMAVWHGVARLKPLSDRLVVVLGLFSLPVAAFWKARQKTYAAWAVVLGVSCVIYGLGHNDTVKAIYPVAWVVVLGTSIVPKFPWLRLMQSGTALVLAGMPLVIHVMPWATLTTTGFFSKWSFHHRLAIWQEAVANILERPLLGGGMEFARAPQFIHEKAAYWKALQDTWGVPLTTLTGFLHPHNMALQLWIEGGAIGVTLAGLCLCVMMQTVARRLSAEVLPFFYGTVVLWGGLNMAAWGLWQGWWWVMALSAFFMLIHLTRAPSPRKLG